MPNKSIHTPGSLKVKEINDTSAQFTIEPLHSGYGMTLGNSLRRVLLSSISGAAITGFRIQGASHEFTTLPHVKEDVVQIILNLKGVRFRLFSDEPQTLQISKTGKGKLTAKDIELNADTEVVNPDHVIATLDDDKAKVAMEIIVQKGRGYHPVDETTKDKLVDMINIDAIYSPVSRVRYRVESTRVGQMTDLDRLILVVDTDGTITPKDAFEEAAAILINQYSALAGQTRVEPGEVLGEKPSSDDAKSPNEEESPALMTSIEDLNLSARTTNALVNNEIHTLQDLVSLSDSELKELKGFGGKALDEVKEKITEMEF